MSDNRSIAVIGAAGRMGRSVLAAATSGDVTVVAGLVRATADPLPLQADRCFTDRDAFLAAARGSVVIDFALGEGAAERIAAVSGAGLPLVFGATGLGSGAEEALDRAAERVAVVVAPNASMGIALLRRALADIVPALGTGWDAALLDRHHRAKRDRPSGTARVLESDLTASLKPEVGVFRGGGVPGEHRVFLSADGEELELVHRAFDRSVFARGALRAADFARTADAGRYGMEDVLFGG